MENQYLQKICLLNYLCTGANKANICFFDLPYEVTVFSHETIACKEVGIVVLFAETKNFINALLSFLS